MSIVVLLKQWRAEKSRKKGVEVFRILPNRTIDEIAQRMPSTAEELLEIHGIGEKKVKEYGEEILALTQQVIRDDQQEKNDEEILDPNVFEDISKKVVSVGEFLDRTNAVLSEMPGAVQGEVSSVDIRDRYIFFTIKDSEDNASMSCFMWRNRYDLCGVELREGLEVVVRGILEVYKPSGRLTFRVDMVEPVGEGVIKAAYEKLKKKLEEEGLFAIEKKRTVPEFPHRIGLITSQEGAVIHDFMSNIGKFGFHIAFVNSRVEGQMAVVELVRAIRTLQKRPLDVLVIIRGGGSLESLQAFNNETIVREIAHFPVPVICGIGHDKDVPLASLAADVMVSTPTAVTRELNTSWERLVSRVDILERDLFNTFERECTQQKNIFYRNVQTVFAEFSAIMDRCRGVEERVRQCVVLVAHALEKTHDRISQDQRVLVERFSQLLSDAKERVWSAEKSIVFSDPRRQLKLGYSIVSSGGRVVRSVSDVKSGDEMDVLVQDGNVQATVKKTSLKKR